MTDVRVTQLIKESVVTETAPDQRVTSAAVEALRTPAAALRVTSAAIEVLRIISSTSTVSAAATVLCIATSGGD